MIPIHFDDKVFEFIHLNFISYENHIINYLPESQREDEILSTLHSLCNTIRNKIFNYKNIVNNINTNDARTYGASTTS